MGVQRALPALLAATLSLAAARAASQPTEVDVVIIGAGWSGMAAADSLARANAAGANVSFVVLESSNRTGGRSHATAFGDPKVWRGVVERGSNWVSGVAPQGAEKGGIAGVARGAKHMLAVNPVYALAQQENFSLARIPGSADGNMSLYEAIYTPDGDVNGDPGARIRTHANAVLDCLNTSKTQNKAKAQATVRDGLHKCGWNPKSPEEWAMDWAMSGEDASGEPASHTSIHSLGTDQTYQFWGADDQFVIDQNPRGYAALLDAMVRDTVPPGDPRVRLRSEVTRVKYDCGGVYVSTRDGQQYKATEVISTLPLGVLQRHHREIFSPPMPKKQVEALESDGFKMGNLTHVVVQFPTVWWEDGLAKWLHANDPDGVAASGEFTLWHNLNHKTLLPGSHSLLSFLGDPQSSHYEGLPDSVVKAALMARLRSQHPNKTIPEPSDFFISRHGYDNNTYGAYSVSFAGWKDKDHAELRKPLRNCGDDPEGPPPPAHIPVVRMAGEAMCDDMNGYTHGARQRGKEQAAHYLYHAFPSAYPNPNKVQALSMCGW